METIRLTQFSTGAGCGCKIAPDVLESILQKKEGEYSPSHDLIIGNDSRDDAAVIRLDESRGLISTNDFFTPIVDDPFDFGYIAAVNSLSDIYAMGGPPILAIAILGWPVDRLGTEVASEVLRGGRAACKEAGLPLAGGHSIESPEPFFGLAANGLVEMAHLKRNDTARDGDRLFLTKPLGTGLFSSAEKREIATEEEKRVAYKCMKTLNKAGSDLGKIAGVHALTDVTGFGLAGHLMEMCLGSDLSACLDVSAIPRFEFVERWIREFCMPNGTTRNWRSYGKEIQGADSNDLQLLADPQTSGGLLIACAASAEAEVKDILKAHGAYTESIGELRAHKKDAPRIVLQ